MDLAAATVIPDPLDRAAAADRLMWAGPRRYASDARELRRVAVLQAVEGGHSRQEIAARLRVQERDVDWLTRVLATPAWRLGEPGRDD